MVTCNACLRIVLAGRFSAHLPVCTKRPLDPEPSSAEPSPGLESSPGLDSSDHAPSSEESSSDEDFCGSERSRKRKPSKGRSRGEGSPGAKRQRQKQKPHPGKSKLSKAGGSQPPPHGLIQDISGAAARAAVPAAEVPELPQV